MSMNRPSLMDMDDFSAVGGSGGKKGKKSGGGGGGNVDSAKIAKLSIAVVVLLLAGVVWALNTGLFRSDKVHKLTPEQAERAHERYDEQEARRKELLDRGEIQLGGA